MKLSDISIKRPVFASVLSLLLVAFGLVAFDRLTVREYPEIDSPIVTVETAYPGAAAAIVESRITELVEERVAGIEGIRFISSTSEDGESNVVLEFNLERDIDSAANDVRDRISGLADNLPDEADPSEVRKVDASDDVVLWFNLMSNRLNLQELTDYAERYLVERFSILDGVSRIRVGGGRTYAMRIWIDRQALAARGLTTADIENALRSENVELPAGNIESLGRQFSVRVNRAFTTAEDFAGLVLGKGEDGYLIRLSDVAQVTLGSVEDRFSFTGNGVPMVGIGIMKQSTANSVDVARLAIAKAAEIRKNLPDDIELQDAYNASVFIEAAISEVYKTLFIAIVLVVLVIYLFLGSIRTMLIPAVTVPVSMVATSILMLPLGFSVNLLTLLAMVLAIGLLVDDSIVVLENIHRRMKEYGESALVAAFRGTRQVGMAVIATTAVLTAVFVPISFMQGDLGRLFSEFALTIVVAVVFSTIVALSLTPMLASKLVRSGADRVGETRLTAFVDGAMTRLRKWYMMRLEWVLGHRKIAMSIFFGVILASGALFIKTPSEYAPQEDRGAFLLFLRGPEGATFAYMQEYGQEVERRLAPLVQSGDINRILVRVPGGFGANVAYNSGMVIAVLNPWGERRSGFEIMDDVNRRLADLPGIRAFSVMRQGISGSTGKPVEFVIGGGSWEQLTEWRDTLLAALEKDNPGLADIDWDYKETQPQVRIRIDYQRAAELGVTVQDIGRTLETMLGSRRVTTFMRDGEEYDVILEGVRKSQSTPSDIENIYVRSNRTGELIPLSNLVTLTESADSRELNRYNRVRAITIEATLANGLTLGEGLAHLEKLAKENLPEEVVIDYKGQSLDFKASSNEIVFVFVMGMLVVFLVLAAQFESWVHPFVIMFSVPLAVGGGLLGLTLSGGTLNIYSEIGLIMLIGLAAKNGILIVEFANQLRDEGMEFREALMTAADSRLRPILMTAITTIAGAIPLVLASGAGSETRASIGIVVISGVTLTTLLTAFIVPVAYDVFARGTGSPGDVARKLDAEAARADAAVKGAGQSSGAGATEPAE